MAAGSCGATDDVRNVSSVCLACDCGVCAPAALDDLTVEVETAVELCVVKEDGASLAAVSINRVSLR